MGFEVIFIAAAIVGGVVAVGGYLIGTGMSGY